MPDTARSETQVPTLEQAASLMLRRPRVWEHALEQRDRVWVAMQPAPVWPWRVTQAVRWACRHG